MIQLSSATSKEHVDVLEPYAFGLYGKVIDDRTQYSVDYIKSSSQNSCEYQYVKDELNVSMDSGPIECHEMKEYFSSLGVTSFIVDATSLSVPELALFLKAVKGLAPLEILFIYVEPEEYSSNNANVANQEEFDLSNDISGFEGTGIPIITDAVRTDCKRKFIFFLGFEGSRLLGAVETYDISEGEAKVVVGVPAFNVGWEVRSIKKNMQAIRDLGIEKSIEFCGANCIEDTIALLRKTHQVNNDRAIYLVPIGTKPNALGALLYMFEEDEVDLLYDQPVKKKGRSEGVGEKHYYRVVVK